MKQITDEQIFDKAAELMELNPETMTKDEEYVLVVVSGVARELIDALLEQ